MKRYTALAIILLTGVILVVASCFLRDDAENAMTIGQDYKVHFLPIDKLFEVSKQANEARIDSMVTALESKTSGINEERYKRLAILDESLFEESPYFVNPEANGGKALDAFFASLHKSDTAAFRVGHYGDSQIEGDRLTNLLRILFQTRFGGNGHGYVPMDDITSSVGYSRISSPNWVRYTVFHNKISGGTYCPGGSAFRYRFAMPATSKDSVTPDGDTVKIRIPAASYSEASVILKLTRPYNIARLWYGNAKEPAHLKVLDSRTKTVLCEVELDSKDPFNCITLPLSSTSTSLRFIFTGPSPEIYGLSFDPSRGVQFDNYGLRGHSGDGYLNIPNVLLASMFKKLNNKLVLLQFGGNVTPYVKDEKTLKLMADMYDRIYRHFKTALPNASVMVIGVNDVAHSVGGNYVSYPMIGRLRDAQKEAALKNGCAFFDLYQLMGGENSVLVWNRKNLASRDGHFSDRGREIVANEIFSAIIAEYNKYLIRNGRKK